MANIKRPKPQGHFGEFGAQYVAETLMPALDELETAWKAARKDPKFKADLSKALSE